MITRHGPGDEISPDERGGDHYCGGCGFASCPCCGPCCRGHDPDKKDDEPDDDYSDPVFPCRQMMDCDCGPFECCDIPDDETTCPRCHEAYRAIGSTP